MKTREVVGCEIPLFDRSVMAIVGCPESEGIATFTKYAKERGADGLIFELTGARGSCTFSGGDIYIWLGDENMPSLFIHEMVHAAFHLCHAIGAEPDQEIIARLVEYMKIHLMDEIYYDAEETCAPEGSKIELQPGAFRQGLIYDQPYHPDNMPTLTGEYDGKTREESVYDVMVKNTVVPTKEFLDKQVRANKQNT